MPAIMIGVGAAKPPKGGPPMASDDDGDEAPMPAPKKPSPPARKGAKLPIKKGRR